MPADHSISLEALWITFTIVLIGFFLCFLVWAVGRHYTRSRNSRRDEDDECERGFLHGLAREFGYRDCSRQSSDADNSSKLLIVRNSFTPSSGSSWRSSLIPSRPVSGPSSTDKHSNASQKPGIGNHAHPTNNKKPPCTGTSSNSQLGLEMIEEDDGEGAAGFADS